MKDTEGCHRETTPPSASISYHTGGAADKHKHIQFSVSLLLFSAPQNCVTDMHWNTNVLAQILKVVVVSSCTTRFNVGRVKLTLSLLLDSATESSRVPVV